MTLAGGPLLFPGPIAWPGFITDFRQPLERDIEIADDAEMGVQPL